MVLDLHNNLLEVDEPYKANESNEVIINVNSLLNEFVSIDHGERVRT